MATLPNPGYIFIKPTTILLLSLFWHTVSSQPLSKRVVRSESPRCHSDPPLIYDVLLLFYIKDTEQEEESKIWLEQAYSINPALKK